MSINFIRQYSKIHGKQTIFSIALILLLTVSGIMAAIPTSKAQTETSPLPTNAYINVSPNPAGINQQVTIEMWLGQPDPTATGLVGGRWQGFTVLITEPDGTTSMLGPFTANDASFYVTTYTPDHLGNYTFKFTFPGQHVTGVSPSSFAPINSYYAASSFTSCLLVQQQPATSYPQTPLPAEYWTRPINSQNSLWYAISGNWLSLGTSTFGSTNYNATGNFNAYTTGPNSAHILWTKPLEDGGLIGGEFGGTDTSNYFTGKSYEMEFTPNIIINGVLFYNAPTNPKEGFYAVDLRTGQTLWWQNSTGAPFQPFGGLVVGWEYPQITLGQVYNYLSPNMEGGFPYLWSTDSNTWYMYDANTGNLILQMAHALNPTQDSQLNVEGPSGELLDYIVGTNWIALWNSSLCIGTYGDYTPPIPLFSSNYWVWSPPIGAILNWEKGVQWNLTAQTYPGEAIVDVNSGIILASTLTGVGGFLATPTADYAMEVGYSATTGQQLWVQNVTLPSGVTTSYDYNMGPMADGIFTAYDALAEQWYGFNANTGTKIWGPTAIDTDPWGSEPGPWQSQIAYGILYGFAADGVHAFNLTTGKLLWTFKGISSGTNFPGFNYYPFEQATMTVADGKLYLNTGVSHGDPVFDGAQLYCVNATSGQLLWNINSFGEGIMPISDGTLVALNGYDNQLYAYGMGPSKTTVTAPDVGVTTSTPVTITGTVTDISAGAQQQAVAANFPNGLPCVSDASMSQFMEAVYMQQPMPTNVTGVKVTLSVIDSNHNTRTIGTTITDASGFYSLNWTPNIPGNFTVTATFSGTQSYYGSSAQTAFYASAQSTTAPTAVPVTGLATMSGLTIGIAVAVIAMIIAIAIVGLLILRKHA
ncbi:MAG: PQQ-binding-like beta-propeller repeat protein [Candidatus Bathyarchaeia archaeon]|jgi:outer membrane protein assembly factor BamB